MHVVSPDFAFNQSMSPGQPLDFTPDHAGVMKLACDIHHHMRGFVVVSPSPWFRFAIGTGDSGWREFPPGIMCSTSGTSWVTRCAQSSTSIDGKSVEVPPLVLSCRRDWSAAAAERRAQSDRAGAAVERGGRSDQRDPGGEPRRCRASRRAGEGAAAGGRRLLGRIRGVGHGNGHPKVPGLCPSR